MNRFSTIEDLDHISELRYKMFEEIGTTSQLVDDFKSKTKDFYFELYQRGKCIHVVYEHQSEIVACAGGILRSDSFLEASFKQPEYGYLMDVYVSPDCRRQGIAQEMIAMLLNWFEQFGVSSVKLDASKLSGDLYSQVGFHTSIQMSLNIKA